MSEVSLRPCASGCKNKRVMSRVIVSKDDIGVHNNRKPINAKRRFSVGSKGELKKVKEKVVIKFNFDKHKDRVKGRDIGAQKRKLDPDEDWAKDIPEGLVKSQISSFETQDRKIPRYNSSSDELSEKEDTMGDEKPLTLDAITKALKAANKPLEDKMDTLSTDVNSFQTKTVEALSNLKKGVEENKTAIEEVKNNRLTSADVIKIIHDQNSNSDSNKEQILCKALKFCEGNIVIVGLKYKKGDMADAKKQVDELISKLATQWNDNETKKVGTHKVIKKSIRESDNNLVCTLEGTNKPKARSDVLKSTKYLRRLGDNNVVRMKKDLPIFYRTKYQEVLKERNSYVRNNKIHEGFITWEGAAMLLKIKMKATSRPREIRRWIPPTANKADYIDKDLIQDEALDFVDIDEELERQAFILMDNTKSQEWIYNALNHILKTELPGLEKEMKNIHINQGNEFSITFDNTNLLESFVKQIHGRTEPNGPYVFRVSTFRGIELKYGKKKNSNNNGGAIPQPQRQPAVNQPAGVIHSALVLPFAGEGGNNGRGNWDAMDTNAEGTQNAPQSWGSLNNE